MSDSQPHQKVYARGFYDGLRAAGITDTSQVRFKTMNLNQARYQSIHNGLSAIAKKVLEAVPIESPWDISKIHSEITRVGHGIDTKTVFGCLNTLVSAGLVTEPKRALFMRVEVKQKDEKPKAEIKLVPISFQKEEQVQQTAKPHAAEEVSAISILSKLALRVNALTKDLMQLGADIETAALEIEDQMTANEEQSKKLKQLQQLLKSLG